MNQIALSKKNVAEYVYAHDSAGNVISGAKAVKRYEQYRKSGIAKPASQAEVTIENFVETVGETFTDKAQYEEFSRKVNALVNNDIREPTEEEWEIYHGKFFAGLKNQKEIDRHKYWFMNENHGNSSELKSALARVVALEGVDRVARRISDNFEQLQDMAIAVSIGYKPVSVDALQRVLIILLPNNVREAAMHEQTDYETPFETDYEE